MGLGPNHRGHVVVLAALLRAEPCHTSDGAKVAIGSWQAFGLQEGVLLSNALHLTKLEPPNL